MKANKSTALKILWVVSLILSNQAYAVVSTSTDTPSSQNAAGVFASPPAPQQTVSAPSAAGFATNPSANKPFELPDTSQNKETVERDPVTGAKKVSSTTSTPTASSSGKSSQSLDPQTNEIVKEIMIEASNARHPKCGCPYSENSDGFECGVESRYYKPSNDKSYCYPQDIRGQQLIFYRKNRQ